MDGRNGGNWWLLQAYTDGYCVDEQGNICFDGKVEVPSAMLQNNTWYDLAVTADAAASRIYLDGVLVDTGVGMTRALVYILVLAIL